MTESAFTAEQREAILEYAAERGDRAASLLLGVEPATLRSWRHRAERKVTDLRDRDAGAPGDCDSGADELVDVMRPSDEWDSALGCEVKKPAKAKIVREFHMGGQFASQGVRRELRTPAAGRLAIGDVILLGGEHVRQFADALWRVVDRQDGGALLVEPARAEKADPRPPPGHESWDDYHRQRQRWQNEQIDEMDRRVRQAREILTGS
jgi:transposase-like protein